MRQSVDTAMIALRGLTERDEKGKPTSTAKEFAKTKQPRKPKKGEKRKRPRAPHRRNTSDPNEENHQKSQQLVLPMLVFRPERKKQQERKQPRRK